MKDTWLNHNTDKLLLFVLTILLGVLILHMVHHTNDAATIAWAENTFGTVLGALIMVLTGRLNRADGQTANGLPPTPSSSSIPSPDNSGKAKVITP